MIKPPFRRLRITLEEFERLSILIGGTSLKYTKEYLDLLTGKITSYTIPTDQKFNDSDELINPDLKPTYDEITQAMIDEYPNRFLPLLYLDTDTIYEFMEEFVNNIKEQKIEISLFRALHEKDPIFSFQEALFKFPTLREQWFVFELNKKREYVLEWLSSQNIEVVLLPNK